MGSITHRLLLCLSLVPLSALPTPSVPRQDLAVLRAASEQFLQLQIAGLPGQVTFSVAAPDSRLNLPACAALEPFLPGSSRVWGKTTVGIRCAAPSPWTVYLSAQVKVVGEYFAAAAPLKQGQVLGQHELVAMQGDLTVLPPGVVRDPTQAVGRTLTASLPAGSPLRQDVLRTTPAVQSGQVVRLTSSGPGFRVSSEGRALGAAAEGQVVQARTNAGQVVSGIAKAGGIVEVSY